MITLSKPVKMDLYSTERERQKQSRIDRYLSTRYLYSTNSRREAAKFERKQLIRKRAAALARLSEELTRCQHIYLNCIHQAGSAHRLAQLIEKVEQIAVSNAKSSQKSNSHENADQLSSIRHSRNFKVNELNSKLIKTAFQNEACLSMVIDREKQLTKQLTIEDKRSIAEETMRSGADRKSSRPKKRGNVQFNEINEFDQETVEKLNDDEHRPGGGHDKPKEEHGKSEGKHGGLEEHDKPMDEIQKLREERSASQLVQSSYSFEDTMLEFEFIYSINERDAGSQSKSQSRSHSQSKTQSKSSSQPKSRQEIQKSIAFGGPKAIDKQIETKSDERSFSRELVETLKISEIQSLESKTEDTFLVSPNYAGRKLFEQKEINYSNAANQPENQVESDEADLKADRKEHLDKKQLDKEQFDKQGSDKVASKQIASRKQFEIEQFEQENSKQTNEVKPNKKHLAGPDNRDEFNLIRSQDLSVQLFSDDPNAGIRLSAESRSDHRSDYERERSVYKSDQTTSGSKRKTANSSDYKANTADYDLSHNLGDLICNLDQDLDHSEHRTLHKQVGKDVIRGEQLNRTIVNEQNQIRTNETGDATKLADYARRESVSYRQVCEEICEELYEASGLEGLEVAGACRFGSHQQSYERVSDNGIDWGGGQFAGERSDQREKLNAKDFDESRKDRQSSGQTRATHRYLPDDLEENLSLRTPSPNSLNESLDLRLFDSTDELPDLLLSSPTLSSSLPSMDSLSTLMSSPNSARKKCPNCSRRTITSPGVENVSRPGEIGGNESRRRTTERKPSQKEDSAGQTTSRKDYETKAKKQIERNRERKAVKIVEHDGRTKKTERFSFEAFWDDVLRGESSSENRLIDLDRLKRKLTKLNQKVIGRK